MNHTDVVENCVTERAIAAALRTNPPSQFEIEVLCRWMTMAEAGPFPEGSWRETVDNSAVPDPDSPHALPGAVVESPALPRPPAPRVTATEHRSSASPLIVPELGLGHSRLIEHRTTYSGIVIQSNGAPETSLIDDINQAVESSGVLYEPADHHLVRPPISARPPASCSTCSKSAHRGTCPTRAWTCATSAAVRVLSQGAWVIDLAASPTDAAPLKAAIGAVWATSTAAPPRRSAYEEEDLLVV